MVSAGGSAVPFHLLVLGPFSREHVVTEIGPHAIARNAETRELIAAAWRACATEAAARGQLLFAGPLCRLHRWHTDGDILRLIFGITDYRELVGTNLTHPTIGDRFGAAYLSNGAGVCAAIETSDGALLVQRRGERVFEHPGKLHVCGGSLEPQTVDGRLVADPFATIAREIEEELGVPSAAIGVMDCLGLARDARTLKPEVMLRVRLNLRAQEIAAQSGEEHSELLIIDPSPNALAAWIGDHWTETAPAGLACLSAYLAVMFATGVASMWESSR